MEATVDQILDPGETVEVHGWIICLVILSVPPSSLILWEVAQINLLGINSNTCKAQTSSMEAESASLYSFQILPLIYKE